MKVLITGATGLVGNEIVRLCKHRQITVNYLTTQRHKIVATDGYTGYYWNPDLNQIDTECFNGVHAIINLAGASISKRWTKSYKKKILDSRINSLKTLAYGLSKIGGHNIKTLVSASAIGIYPSSLSTYYKEGEKGMDDGFLGDVVSQWEGQADQFKESNLSVAKVRTGLVLSNKGGALPKMAKPIRYGLGAAFGSGKQWQSWIHLSDLANIYLFLVEQQLSGTYNAVAPNPVSNAKLTKEIAKALGRPLLLPNVPRSLVRVAAGEMSSLLFASQRVSCKKIEAAGYDFKYRNICTALGNIYREQEVPGQDSHIKNEFVS
ncbi:MAG TPA: TIGR01777 family oxidoreductase [Arenibacter sp.]|nr:TIGR01777 family oxidoreductase [Arenibacter sp.]